MAESFLTDQYYRAGASAKPYMAEALKANNLCKDITSNTGGGGGGLKLASGGIIMAGVALGALFLLSGAKKGGKGRKL
jgi:hypothetical protein